MDNYDVFAWILGGLGGLIAGISWSRKSVFGLLVGIILITVAWFELFIY